MGRWDNQTREERFWRKVNKGGPLPDDTDPLVSAPKTSCWVWTAADNGVGYGMFWVGSGEKKMTAHGFSYRLVHPDYVPSLALVLDHLCRNTLCVNPAHLELIPGGMNRVRGYVNGTRPLCKWGHPLVGENALPRSEGGNRCRLCTQRKALREKAIRRDSRLNPKELEYLKKEGR